MPLRPTVIAGALVAALSLASPTLAEVGTPISSLPQTISDPGRYYLTGDLTLNDGNGISIQADNVIIDLCGYSLVGTDDAVTAILSFASFIRNVTVQNGEIVGWRTAISTGSPTTILDVNVRSCVDGFLVGFGSRIERCNLRSIANTAVSPDDGSSVLDCQVINARTGVTLGTGAVARRVNVRSAETAFRTRRGAVIQECTAVGFKDYGVHGFGPCTIENSTFLSGPAQDVGIGLDLDEGSRVSQSSVHLVLTGIVARGSCTIRDTVVYDCKTGVELGEWSSFVGGEVHRTELHAIAVTGRGARVADATVADNAGAGIEFREAGGLVERCIVSANGADGLSLLEDSIARENLLRGNQGAGVVCTGDGNRLENNTLHENGAGIVVAGRDNLLVANRVLDSQGPDLTLAPMNPAGPFLTSTGWLTSASALSNYITPLF